MIELRPYQVQAHEALRNAFRAGNRRVMLYSPTGSGKSEIAFEMIRLATEKGNPSIFVAPRIELVAQASRRLFAAGIDHGVIQGDNTFGVHREVLVASIQTLARRGVPDQVKFVVVDEAHGCAGSKAYHEMFRQLSALPVVGLSATPFSNGLGKSHPEIGPLFERLVVASTIRELIEQGYLVDVDIYAPGEPDLSGVKIVAGDYHEKQLGDAVDKAQLIGDIVRHWFRLSNDKPTVVFATNIAHSKHIVEQFRSAGVYAEHIDCYTSDEERRSILRGLDRGATRVVSNVSVLAEGWDSPKCETMILARPTRSLIRYIQMAGRILRPHPGKTKALILDHSGTCKRLGFPTDDFPLELDDGKPRSESAPRAKDEQLPKACPSCHYMKPPKVHACPKCGFAPQKRPDVNVQDGQLVKMERGKIKTADKQILYAELLGYAKRRGWKDGWAYFAVKDLCGSAPRERPEARAPSESTLCLIQHLNIKRAHRRAVA